MKAALGFLAGLIVACAAPTLAEPYIGLAIGRSHASLPGSSDDCSSCIHHQLDTRSTVYSAFAGYRYKQVAGEIGFGDLSHYASHNVGPMADGTLRDIRQEIDTRQSYLRAIAFGPKVLRVEPFVSFGFARVQMKNHEWGFNDPSRQFVEQINYDSRTRPTYGLGLDTPIYGKTSARFELTHIRHVAVSRWSLEQNVTVGWAGIVVRL